MNVLVYFAEDEVAKKTRFCLETQGSGLQVFSAETVQSAIERFLDEDPIDLVVTDLQAPTDKLFKYILSTGASIPIVLVVENPSAPQGMYPDIKVVGKVKRAEMSDTLWPLIQTSFAELLKRKAPEEFVRIDLDLLVRIVPLLGDVYIKLSTSKYVRVFKSGSSFTKEDLERYTKQKKLTYLYVKRTESREFVDKFKADLAATVARATAGDQSLLKTVETSQEMIRELTNRIGFTPEVQELAKTNVDLAVKAIGGNPKLSDLLKSSKLAGENYISQHSTTVGYLACAIAVQMDWPSNTTFQKLVMAALFHDFCFQDAELARYATLADVEKMRLLIPEADIQSVKSHPVAAAELIRNLSEHSTDVGVIIQQHHERPDGSGFPKGMRGLHIAPLAAVFIVAHELVNEMSRLQDKFNMKAFAESHRKDYDTGIFKRILAILFKQEEPTAPGAPTTPGTPTAPPTPASSSPPTAA